MYANGKKTMKDKIKLFNKGRLCGLLGNEFKFYMIPENKCCILKECGVRCLT